MPESGQYVLLRVKNDEYYEVLPLSKFSIFEGGVPSVGQQFYIQTKCLENDFYFFELGPIVRITNVIQGTCRNFFPEELKKVYAHILNKEGYSVSATLVETTSLSEIFFFNR